MHYQYVTPTPATHQRVNQRASNARARSVADIFGWSRPFERSLLSQDLFENLLNGGILVKDQIGWRSRVRVSTLDGDAYIHSAFPTVAADAVFFGPDTYRFARCIRSYLSRNSCQIDRAIDIGAGAGVGGMVIAKRRPCKEVVLTDINERALHFAQVNALSAGITNLTFIKSDIFTEVDGLFDLIVANPPYLNDPLKRTYRDGGGELGSALSLRIAHAATTRLAPGGSLLLYTGAAIVSGCDPLLSAIRSVFEGSSLRWSYEELDPDVFGEELENPAYDEVDRIAAVLLTATMPGEL
jgi:methylase of polypeptide subunit release factors